MSDNYDLRIGLLPKRMAIVSTDEHDELTFHFAGLQKYTDDVYRTTTVYAASIYVIDYLSSINRDTIATTGSIDKKGVYSFSRKSDWAAMHMPVSFEAYDAPIFFKNSLASQLKQRKLYTHVD